MNVYRSASWIQTPGVPLGLKKQKKLAHHQVSNLLAMHLINIKQVLWHIIIF
jgi:hypothetical protein